MSKLEGHARDWSTVEIAPDGDLREAQRPEKPARPAADPIYEQQRRIMAPLHWDRCPRSAEDYFRLARHLELEASRGYSGSRRTLWYARNQISAGWERVVSGQIGLATPPWPVPFVPQCSHCGGPSEGLWGCGGPVTERVSKHSVRTVCAAQVRPAWP